MSIIAVRISKCSPLLTCEGEGEERYQESHTMEASVEGIRYHGEGVDVDPVDEFKTHVEESHQGIDEQVLGLLTSPQDIQTHGELLRERLVLRLRRVDEHPSTGRERRGECLNHSGLST